MIAIPRGITVCSSVRAVGAKARVRVCMRVHVRVRGQLQLWARAMRCSAFLCKLPHPARGAAAALSLAVGPRLEAQQRFPSLTQPLGATHSEFLRVHKRKAPAGVAQSHACHSSVSAQATTPPQRCVQRPPHARRRARGRDERRHSRPPRFAHTWHCRCRRGRVPARPHSTVHRSRHF
jgi:hypothetical protein